MSKALTPLMPRGRRINSNGQFDLRAYRFDARIYQDSLYLGTQINTPAVYSTSGPFIGLTRCSRPTCHPEYSGELYSARGVNSGQNSAFVVTYSSRVPLGQAIADEIADKFFIYHRNAGYVTGQVLAVDEQLITW